MLRLDLSQFTRRKTEKRREKMSKDFNAKQRKNKEKSTEKKKKKRREGYEIARVNMSARCSLHSRT